MKSRSDPGGPPVGGQASRRQMIAVGLHMFLPALGQERIEIAARMQARMHVAIDDPQAGFGGRFLVKNRAVDDITHAILLGICFRRRA
jgi:hypothetical protein